MSLPLFLYPRTISIARPQTQSTAGKVQYLGKTIAAEDTLFSGLRCSIQAKSMGSRRIGGQKLAADAPGPVVWTFYIPKSVLAKGSVKNSDVIYDDEGNRYLVASNYWNSLGYRLQAIREEI